MAVSGKQRMKIVLPEGVEIRDLYRLAAERQVQIRRLDYKRDSLRTSSSRRWNDGEVARPWPYIRATTGATRAS